MESHTSQHADLVQQIAQLAQSMNGKEMTFDAEITARTDIMRDLKLDSLAVMDFIMALETRFNTIIPVDGMAELRTVGDLADLLASQLRAPAEAAAC